jgi:protein-disulfide isomerase
MKGIVFTQYLLSRGRANGTPTFFINGERYDGTYDLEHLLDTLTPQSA